MRGQNRERCSAGATEGQGRGSARVGQGQCRGRAGQGRNNAVTWQRGRTGEPVLLCRGVHAVCGAAARKAVHQEEEQVRRQNKAGHSLIRMFIVL